MHEVCSTAPHAQHPPINFRKHSAAYQRPSIQLSDYTVHVPAPGATSPLPWLTSQAHVFRLTLQHATDKPPARMQHKRNMRAAVQDIKLYGIVKIKGFWLPFAFLVLGMFIGGDVMSDILGIAVGHAWYFFTTLLPRGTGKQYLPTPWYIRWAAAKLELGPQRPAVSVAPPPGQRPPGAPPAGGAQGQGGFRAFGGAARRLGSS